MIGYGGDPSALSAVNLRSVNAYLKSRGWHRIGSYGNAGHIFGLDRHIVELLVPLSPLADYEHRMGEILETLSEVEERDIRAILRDLLLSEFDLVRVRLPEATADGSVPIAAAATLFQEARNLLLAAACSASRPQRAFRAGRNQEANNYMNTVRLGQTEMGSFVANVLSPIPPNLVGQADMSTGLPPEPFARKVTRRLVSGLRSAKEAVALVNLGEDISAFEQRVSQGVSANLCDAIANILDYESRESFDISVSWSLIRETPESSVHVVFKESDLLVLKEASRILKDRQERPNERIDGYVYGLARGQTEHEGRVTLKAVVDGAMSSVRVDFDPPDYSRITEAHDQRRVVSLEGDLRREGQRWVLGNPRDLEVEADDDDE
jgi:hypothetical protein